jgi:hypothetical protein
MNEWILLAIVLVANAATILGTLVVRDRIRAARQRALIRKFQSLLDTEYGPDSSFWRKPSA